MLKQIRLKSMHVFVLPSFHIDGYKKITYYINKPDEHVERVGAVFKNVFYCMIRQDYFSVD